MRYIRRYICALLFSLSVTTLFYILVGDGLQKIVHAVVEETSRFDFGKVDAKNPTAENLWRKVRVLCFVPTSQRHLATKTIAVRDTWAKRCNRQLFFSSETNSSFPTIRLPGVRDGSKHLTHKTMAAFQFIFNNNFHEADWFLKADDDTYIIMDNLRYMLSNYDPQQPLYFGHDMEISDLDRQHEGLRYASGGGGYVLSREALRILVTRGIRTEYPCWTPGGAEDAAVGRCMRRLGVPLGRTDDGSGRDLFHPFSLATHLFGGVPEWYRIYRKDYKQGSSCCGRFTISFHYVDPVTMYQMDHLLYRTAVYGLQGIT